MDDEVKVPPMSQGSISLGPQKYNYYHMTAQRVNMMDTNGQVNPDKLEAIMNQQEFMKAM